MRSASSHKVGADEPLGGAKGSQYLVRLASSNTTSILRWAKGVNNRVSSLPKAPQVVASLGSKFVSAPMAIGAVFIINPLSHLPGRILFRSVIKPVCIILNN